MTVLPYPSFVNPAQAGIQDAQQGHGTEFTRRAMKIRYFPDTDTLYIEFRDREIAETRDLDENTLLDLDADCNACALTLEHASTRTDIGRVRVEGMAA